MDLFSTTALNRVVAELPLPRPQFFLNYFNEVDEQTTEDVKFDVTPRGRRLITPYVSPLIRGRVVKERGFKTKSVAPAYLKDKRNFEPSRYFKRTAGEKIGGSLTPAQRLGASVAFAVGEQMQMWYGRLEQMAAEVVRTGKIVIESQDFERSEIDFGRDPSLTDIFSGNDLWSNPASDPLQVIEDGAQAVFDGCGFTVTDVVMASNVWRAVKTRMKAAAPTTSTDAIGKSMLLQLDTRIDALDAARSQLGPHIVYPGASLVAVFGDFRLWVYAGKYEDPETGAEADLLPAGWLTMVANTGYEGVRIFGSIKDLKAGMQATPFFVKSWEEEEPSVRYMLGQSAPLIAPYRPNASYAAKVL